MESISKNLIRRRLKINGVVQGVGFRPFVYRIAIESGVTGFVYNDSEGVSIEIESDETNINYFLSLLKNQLPPLARIDSISSNNIEPLNEKEFIIKSSDSNLKASTLISPDIATCDDCLNELFDPQNRRYLYPFINCTNCGPRYTIVEHIPYDRPYTSMKKFPLCKDCKEEYDNPLDRRFHAQPNACFICGPKLSIHNGIKIIDTDNPVKIIIDALKEGRIAAIRGVGGFHLAVDAKNDNAANELRKRKQREEKPLALMADKIETIKKYADVSQKEHSLLKHHSRPIVLLRKLNDNSDLASSLVYENKYYGFMLPYTPVHHLLLSGSLDVLVMTSGNLSDEPIAVSNDEAISRLATIADIFLLHNREILQRCDDSIIRFAANEKIIIRRARGFVPEPVYLNTALKKNILAVGAELKNTIALGRDNTVFHSQHIGDLDNPLALEFFENSIVHLKTLLEIEPEIIACDIHPEYLSTKWAKAQHKHLIEVQHHHAHMVSVMAENNVDHPVAGLILDGTGYGIDHTIWGGEVLYGNAAEYGRYAYLEPVAMLGGVQAIKQPWRMALSYLYHIFGNQLIDMEIPFLSGYSKMQIEVTLQMIAKKLNSPLTSSCGRIFDAVSALLNIGNIANYEAQSAITLEMTATACSPSLNQNMFSLKNLSSEPGPIKWKELVHTIYNKIMNNEPVPEIASWFHVNLAELLINSVLSLCKTKNLDTVALSGGVYQNLLFFEYIVRRFEQEKLNVLTHKQVPTNDGGIALGQTVVANAVLSMKK